MIEVIVDNRLRMHRDAMPDDFRESLEATFTHNNPQHAKLVAMGHKFNNEPKEYVMWRDDTLCQQGYQVFSLPRGGMQKLRDAFDEFDLDYKMTDRRSMGAPHITGSYVDAWQLGSDLFPAHKLVPWDHQTEMVAAANKYGQILMRAPTGSGKSAALIKHIAEAQVPALVIIYDTGLLKQWRECIENELGIPPAEQGMIQGSKFRLKSITLAMQQTLARWDDAKWARLFYANKNTGLRQCIFGSVYCDECFEADTPVLMADGGTKCIADVQVGDVTMVGGVVRDTMARDYDGDVYELNGSLVTAEHPVATLEGWVPISKIRSDDIVWYDPEHELRRMQPAIETRQQGDDARAVQEVVRSQGGVSGVRSEGTQAQTGVPCVDQMLDGRSVESGVDGSRTSAVGQSYQGYETGRGTTCEYSEGIESTRDQEAPQVGDDRSGKQTPTTIHRQSRVARVESQSHVGDDTRWSVDSIRWSEIRERVWPDSKRSEVDAENATARVRLPAGRNYIRDDGPTVTLQDRLRSSEVEVGSGVGRFESQHTEASSGRRTQDILPRIEGVAGVALPGAGELRRRRAKVSRSSRPLTRVYNIETEHNVYVAAGTLVHNCQRYAARTFVDFIDRFDCHYRIGVSADEKRKDRKTFIIYDMFGPVRHEVSKQELVKKRIIHEVECYVIPTAFHADWYVKLKEDDILELEHHKRLLDEMAVDEDRNILAVHLIKECVQAGLPTLAFTQWVDHARRIDAALTAKGIASGLALGGKPWEEIFDETIAQLRNGKLQVGCGTFGKLGVGHDIPAVAAGLAITPIHNNKGFLGQVKGRICRTTQGKENARILVMWDRLVFGDMPLANLRAWNEVCRVWNEWDKRWQDINEYMKEMRDGRTGTPTTAANEEGLFLSANAGGNHGKPKRRRA